MGRPWACGLIGYQELRFRRLDKQMCSRTAIATMQKQKGSLVQGGWCRRTWGWEERERVIRASAWFVVRYLWAKTKLFLNLMRAPGTVREAWYREDGGLCLPVSSMSSSSSSSKVKQSMLESDTREERLGLPVRTNSINQFEWGEVMLGSEVRGTDGERRERRESSTLKGRTGRTPQQAPASTDGKPPRRRGTGERR